MTNGEIKHSETNRISDEDWEWIFSNMEGFLSKVPPPLRKSIETNIYQLRELLMDTRPPRFAFVGRRGSGKSSLLNAITGEACASVGDVSSMTGASQWYSV